MSKDCRKSEKMAMNFKRPEIGSGFGNRVATPHRIQGVPPPSPCNISDTKSLGNSHMFTYLQSTYHFEAISALTA